MTQNVISDEDLTAYLDGEAGADLLARIKTALKEDRGLQDRLDLLAVPMESMKEAFGDVITAAPEMPPLPNQPNSIQSPTSVRFWTALAASAILGAVIGFWGLQKAQTKDWRDYAAAYHVLYVNRTLADVQTSPSQTMAEVEQLGAVLGHDLAPAPLDKVLDFKRGQVLGYQGQPLVQLAYLSPLGDPVALCLIRTNGADRSVQMSELEGLSAATWQSDGIAYLLIGGTDAGLIQNAAARFSDAL